MSFARIRIIATANDDAGSFFFFFKRNQFFHTACGWGEVFTRVSLHLPFSHLVIASGRGAQCTYTREGCRVAGVQPRGGGKTKTNVNPLATSDLEDEKTRGRWRRVHESRKKD